MKTNHTYYNQIKQIISIVFILYFFNSNIYSQTMDLYDVEYHNTQIPHCSSIDLNFGPEHYITFKLRLEKFYYGNSSDNNDIAGDVYMKLGARGTDVTLVSEHIDLNSWTVDGNIQYFELTGSVSISNSQLNDSGSAGVLFALYHSNNGNNFPSCDYNITRPEYILSPSSSSISCGQSNAIFNVSDVNNSIGYLVYHWSVGTGWKTTNGDIIINDFTTTSSSLNIVPYQYPPSDIHVTPELDGVMYEELTSTVSLSDFNPSNTISGVDSFCNTNNNSTYSVYGLPSGTNISSWTSSNTNIVTVNPINNHQATITKIGIGSATITAIISNSCGQQKSITKQVWTGGEPKITLVYGFDGTNFVDIHLRGTGGFDINKQGITSTTWQKISNSGGCYANFGGSGFEGLAHGNCSDWIVRAKITATNSCGTTTIYRDITPPDPCANNNSRLIVVNNPMKEGASTNRLLIDDEPCDRNNYTANNQTSKNYTISIYNKYGEKVYTKIQHNREFVLDKLKKGFFIVKYQTKKGEILTKKLIIK